MSHSDFSATHEVDLIVRGELHRELSSESDYLHIDTIAAEICKGIEPYLCDHVYPSTPPDAAQINRDMQTNLLRIKDLAELGQDLEVDVLQKIIDRCEEVL